MSGRCAVAPYGCMHVHMYMPVTTSLLRHIQANFRMFAQNIMLESNLGCRVLPGQEKCRVSLFEIVGLMWYASIVFSFVCRAQ